MGLNMSNTLPSPAAAAAAVAAVDAVASCNCSINNVNINRVTHTKQKHRREKMPILFRDFSLLLIGLYEHTRITYEMGVPFS